jgi:hypothetical protein
MMTLSVLLVISISLNILLIWYARRLAKQFLFFTENVADLENTLNAFGDHLNGVHEMEMFYGDDTLGALIEHSRAIVTAISDFYEGFSLEETKEENDGNT